MSLYQNKKLSMKRYSLTIIFLYLSATTNPFYCMENKGKKESTFKLLKKNKKRNKKKSAKFKSNAQSGKSQVRLEKTETPSWSSHNFKHFSPKGKSWTRKHIKKNKKSVYIPDLDVEQLERTVWNKGTPISDEQKVMEFDAIVGMSSGKKTRYSRVEISSLNTIHGRPLTPDRAESLLTETEIAKASLKPYIKDRQLLAEVSD